MNWRITKISHNGVVLDFIQIFTFELKKTATAVTLEYRNQRKFSNSKRNELKTKFEEWKNDKTIFEMECNGNLNMRALEWGWTQKTTSRLNCTEMCGQFLSIYKRKKLWDFVYCSNSSRSIIMNTGQSIQTANNY